MRTRQSIVRGWAGPVVAGLAIFQVGASGCVRTGPRAPAVAGTGASTWRYEVGAGGVADATALRIEAWFPRGTLADLVVRRGATRFVEDVEIEVGGAWHDVPRVSPTPGVHGARGVTEGEAAFHAPECARGCHLRYRFALGRAAEILRDTDMAIRWGDVVLASPSVWLLHPTLAPAGARYRFHVDTEPGSSFVTGVFAAEDDHRTATYEADASTISAAPYAAFGDLRTRHVDVVPGAALDVAIAPGAYDVSDDALVDWATRSASTLSRFLGCFPIERALVLVAPTAGRKIRRGETMGDGGASIIVEVGEHAGAEELARDWVLPHEMTHLAVPSLARQHHWVEEGVAVYLEPIARARTGELRPEEVWRRFALGMPQGVPARGDRGLDETPGWARTYWGGATFCLLADLDIRRRTGNRLGFEDALRGVLAAGGNVASIWELDRLVDTADAWVGAPVLRATRDEMAARPWTVDLARLFGELGVIVRGDDVVLVDDAPLAPLRRAITAPLPSPGPAPVACRWATDLLAGRRVAAR